MWLLLELVNNLHMNTNNILSPVSHETHSNKLNASPCTSFSDPLGHFLHKKPKSSHRDKI